MRGKKKLVKIFSSAPLQIISWPREIFVTRYGSDIAKKAAPCFTVRRK